MKRRTLLSIGSLVLLLVSSTALYADPILYSTSGQIRFGDGAFETFHGSFVLSDPTVTTWDASDSRGRQRDSYSVSDFGLFSNSYSLTGQGEIAVWWGFNPDRINPIDSAVRLQTSAGFLDSGLGEFPQWEGAVGAQPIRFYDFDQVIRGAGQRVAVQILNMTAVNMGPVARVPEPSALLLYGAGIAGVALLRRRMTS